MDEGSTTSATLEPMTPLRRLEVNARRFKDLCAAVLLGATLLGLIWTVCFYASLTSGFLDPESMSLSQIVQIVAIGTILGFGLLFGFGLCAPGLISLLPIGKPDRIFPLFHVYLGAFLLVSQTAFASSAIVFAVGIALPLVYATVRDLLADRDRYGALPWLVTFAWLLAYFVLAHLVANTAGEALTGWQPAFYLVLVVALTIALNIYISTRDIRTASVTAGFIVMVLFLSNGHGFFTLPYRSFGLADYWLKILPRQAEVQTWEAISKRCPDEVKRADDIHPAGMYEIYVAASLGDYYVVRCSQATAAWIGIPKRSDERFLVSDERSKGP